MHRPSVVRSAAWGVCQKDNAFPRSSLAASLCRAAPRIPPNALREGGLVRFGDGHARGDRFDVNLVVVHVEGMDRVHVHARRGGNDAKRERGQSMPRSRRSISSCMAAGPPGREPMGRHFLQITHIRPSRGYSTGGYRYTRARMPAKVCEPGTHRSCAKVWCTSS